MIIYTTAAGISNANSPGVGNKYLSSRQRNFLFGGGGAPKGIRSVYIRRVCH